MILANGRARAEKKQKNKNERKTCGFHGGPPERLSTEKDTPPHLPLRRNGGRDGSCAIPKTMLDAFLTGGVKAP
jgi:hypothetical protein